MLRAEIDVKYIRDLAVIVPLDVPVSSTYEHLLSMIYLRIAIDKKQFQLVLNCSAPIAMNYECRVDEDEEECESQEGDDQSERAEDVQHDGNGVFEFIDEENNNVNVVSSFLALHEAMESEQRRYVFVDGEENIGNVVSSDWTPWKNTNIGNSSGEFMVGQVFNSKADLQHAPKLYFISAHQEYVVVSSTTKLLVLRCKKAEQSQCPWKLRAMVAQFTLSVAAIQSSIVGKFRYQISYKNASKAKLKALTNLFGDFYKSYAELPHFFIALEQTNPGCVVISKTFPSIMENTEIFQRVFWTFQPSVEGLKHCHPVLNIDGTHLYGKYKDTLMIAMGCDGNNKLFPLAFGLTKGIMAAMSDVHLGWFEPYAYHRKWALSDDGGRRYDIMTTNMSEVFNSVLKRACSLPATALVQLTFFRLNSYFVVRREQGANRLTSNEEYTPYVDAKIKANVVKAGSHEIVLYDHIQGQFHVKTNRGTKSSSTGGQIYRVNLHEYACTCDMEYRGHSSDPDPLDMSVLVLQDRHRSHLVDSGQLWSWERLHLGRPDFDRPPTPPAAQHLEHDAADDLPVEHLDQGLQNEALLDEGLLADLLGYRQGRHKYDWVAFHAQYITLWTSRAERIATTLPMVGAMQFHDPYMEWYRRITRCLIAPPLHRDQMRYHSTATTISYW
ncbi:hypothetical protein CK203_036407 [Vitis vinifera]|uniref:Transposase MuDR plant domain-containing protein n=1 Tax=Vitis vinifera TaxID=29760 RepID=A0A438HZ27_VITVI|nr:hypothetical protein CK203_036407 [Vitis vinifera]